MRGSCWAALAELVVVLEAVVAVGVVVVEEAGVAEADGVGDEGDGVEAELGGELGEVG